MTKYHYFFNLILIVNFTHPPSHTDKVISRQIVLRSQPNYFVVVVFVVVTVFVIVMF